MPHTDPTHNDACLRLPADECICAPSTDTTEAGARRRVGLPDGGYLEIPAEHYDKMVAAGAAIALSPEEEIADILELANAKHRPGCSHSRTGKCLCDYLAKWDDPDTTPLQAFTEQMAAEDRVIAIDTLPETSAWDGVFKGSPLFDEHGPLNAKADQPEPDPARPEEETTAEQIHADFDPVKRISADDYQPEAAPFPMEEKNYYPEVTHPGLKSLTVNGEIWEARGTMDGELLTAVNTALSAHSAAHKLQHNAYRELQNTMHAQMKRDHRTILFLTVSAVAGWALSLARGIWGF